jgi:hypothetical protein
VDYNGFSYAALDLQTTPNSTSLYCQNYWLGLPDGWSIAPHDAASIAVVASRPWGTHVVILQGGASYWANQGSGSAGTLFSSSSLEYNPSTDQYRASICNVRILLKYNSGSVSSITCHLLASMMPALATSAFLN